MEPKKLTEYERKRLENIKRNGEMMAVLKIHSKTSQLSPSTKRQRVGSKSYKLSLEKKPKTQTPVVIRRSLRARGMPPDSNGLRDDFVESVDKTPEYLSPTKPSPRYIGPLKMTDAYNGTGSDKKFIDSILGVEKKPHLGVSVKEDFSCVKACKEEKLSDLGEQKRNECGSFDLSKVVKIEYMNCPVKVEKCAFESSFDVGSFSLELENIARVVPGRIMAVKFLPSTDIRMIVVGNKFGNIGFWNLDCKNEEEDGIFVYRPHTGPISGILSHQSSLSKIFTSCYDGFIRFMDAEKEVFDLVYSSDDTIFSLSQLPNDVNSLYFGEGRGGLNNWDLRTGKSLSQWILHENRINSIDFNSQNPYIMATSSTDGTACLWDLRSMDADKPKTLRRVSHERAVHSAYFSPSGSVLATTSLDNKVGILSGVNFEDTSMIYHDNQTGRWISSFRGIWGWDDSYIFIGNMRRGVDVISPAQRRTVMTLQSPHMSAIPCRYDAHPCKVGMLAGATSGGQVYMWTLD